jgi:hypothetical protein
MKWLTTICAGGLILSAAVAAHASNAFLADSNQFGYTGTVQNVTLNTSPVSTPTPRDASLFFAQNVPVTAPDNGVVANANDMESNWYQQSVSNTNAGFFQINDNGSTVTSAQAVWTQQVGGLWNFTCTITGANATIDSNSRLWQPDNGLAPGGTFNPYTYTLTATGMTTTVIDGWRYNTDDPTGITGSFNATFLSTQPTQPGAGNATNTTRGDTYQAALTFDKTLYSSEGWNNVYEGVDYGYYSEFGAAVVPVPLPASAAVGFGMLAGFGVLLLARKRLAQKPARIA